MRPPSSLARPPVSRYTDRRRGRADSGIRHGPVSRAGCCSGCCGYGRPIRRAGARPPTDDARLATRAANIDGASGGRAAGAWQTWQQQQQQQQQRQRRRRWKQPYLAGGGGCGKAVSRIFVGGPSSGLSTQAIHRLRAYLPTCKYKASQRRSSSDHGIDAARSLQRSGAGGLQISIDIYRRRPGCGKAAARRCCCRSTG